MPSLIRIFASMTLNTLNFAFYKHVLTQKNYEKYIIKHVLAEHSLNRHEYIINLCFNRTCIMYCQKVCDGRTCFKKGLWCYERHQFLLFRNPLAFHCVISFAHFRYASDVATDSNIVLSERTLLLNMTSLVSFQRGLLMFTMTSLVSFQRSSLMFTVSHFSHFREAL